MKPYILAIMTTATLASCDADKEERTEAPGGKNQEPIQSVANDEETSSQVITAQVDDAISAAGEDQESETSAGLMLADADKKKVHKRFRSCSVVDGKAVVEMKRSIDRSFSNEGPVRSHETSFTLLDERTRTWAMADGSVACSDNKKHAVIPWANIQGMTTSVVFNSSKSRQSTLTNKKKGTTVSSSHTAKAEGERTISWSNIASESSVIVQKSIVSNVSRELTIVKKDGTSKTVSSNVVIGSDNPLIIAVERDKTSLDVVSRTISSGKIVATGKDGGRIETVFDGVKYTKENKCMASAGKISGAIYAKDATEASVTFEITFDGESRTIVYSDGKEAEYSPDGCIFDEPEDVTETENKDEVKAAEPAE